MDAKMAPTGSGQQPAGDEGEPVQNDPCRTDTPSETERRQHPRKQVPVRVDCTGREVLLNHRATDISLGGVFVQSDSLEPVGGDVDLVLFFPDGESLFAAQGRVVRTREDATRGMGLRFMDLDEERLRSLRRCI